MFLTRKPQNIKRRKLDEAGEARLEDEKNEGDDELAVVVSEVKLIQKYRKKQKGLVVTADEGSRVELEGGGSTQQQVVDEEQHRGGLLDRSFKTQGERQGEHVDRHLESYLKDRLGKSKEPPPTKGDCVLSKADAALYVIPEHLQVEDRTQEQADKMTWVTGLVEVPLPIEYKLQNIEETEKAKREMLHLGQAPPTDAETEAAVVKTAFGSRFTNWERPKSAASSDDQALHQFRKRFRK